MKTKFSRKDVLSMFRNQGLTERIHKDFIECGLVAPSKEGNKYVFLIQDIKKIGDLLVLHIHLFFTYEEIKELHRTITL